MFGFMSSTFLSMPRMSLRAATDLIVERDPAFAPLVAAAGRITWRTRNPDGPFGALVRAIVFQQLAGAAASAIHRRVRALVDGELTPEAVLGLSDSALRGAGLSASKLASVRDLAQHAADGGLPLDDAKRLSDDEVIARLVPVRGIGKWTAEMFLIFELRRFDVWPVDDLGVRSGYAAIHGLAARPSPKELEALGEIYRPVRTVAALYCWEAVHLGYVQSVRK